MQTPEYSVVEDADESSLAGNGYYGNPYHTAYEQYGFEHIGRVAGNEDDIENVVILGYN